MDDDGGEVIDLPRAHPKAGLKHSVISRLLEEDAAPEPPPGLREFMAHPQAHPPGPDPAPVPEDAAAAERLTPLPGPGTPYEAHSRLANRPLATLFFIGPGGLPHGFAYPNLEQVWMAEPKTPGGSPDLMLLFNGRRPREVRVEGRDLNELCVSVGRHLIH